MCDMTPVNKAWRAAIGSKEIALTRKVKLCRHRKRAHGHRKRCSEKIGG